MNLHYKGYSAHVASHAGIGILCGELDGISDLVAFQSPDMGGAELAFRESVDDYLSLCSELGRNPDQPLLH